MAVNTSTDSSTLPSSRGCRSTRACSPSARRGSAAVPGIHSASAPAISSDSADSSQKLPRQPMASAASVPSGMPNSIAAVMPR